MITTQQWLGIDETHLVLCQNTHKLQATVAEAFARMQVAAQADGVDLQLVSSYRSFDRQLHIWNQKWQGKRPLYSIDNALLDANQLNDEQRLHAILTWSALPGASRHHWGTDFDVYDKTAVEACEAPFQLVDSEYAQHGPCYKLNCWLASHAAQFGFYRPYAEYHQGVAPEAWHLSYKEIADEIIASLSIQALSEQLADTDIQGKAAILANLDNIFVRYTLNQGKQV